MNRQLAIILLALTSLSTATVGDAADSATHAARATSWELSPYRIHLAMYVEPSPRLNPTMEKEWTKQLVATATVAMGGPCQIAVNDRLLAHRQRMLVELSNIAPPTTKGFVEDLQPETLPDKFLFVAVQDVDGDVRIVAREYDVACRVWNVPVARRVSQVSQVPREAVLAMQAAFAPLARIETVERDVVTLKFKAASLPKRDGSLSPLDHGVVFRPVILQLTANLQPKSAKLVPWTYLTPLPGAAGKSGEQQATFRAKLHSGLKGDFLPAYHPLQPRLALGIARSEMPTQLRLVDAADETVPLEGYEVLTEEIEEGTTSGKRENVGVTNRQGELAIPASDAILRRLIVTHGGHAVFSIPFVAGLQQEWKVPLPSDRRRLELAATVAEFHDELVDLVAKQAVLALRLQAGIAKQDLGLVGALSTELKNSATNSKLEARLQELKKSVGSADEATQEQLRPALAQADETFKQMKSLLEKLP